MRYVRDDAVTSSSLCRAVNQFATEADNVTCCLRNVLDSWLFYRDRIQGRRGHYFIVSANKSFLKTGLVGRIVLYHCWGLILGIFTLTKEVIRWCVIICDLDLTVVLNDMHVFCFVSNSVFSVEWNWPCAETKLMKRELLRALDFVWILKKIISDLLIAILVCVPSCLY